MTSIKQLIEEYIGPRCADDEPGCVICDTWREYDILTEHLRDKALEEEMRRFVNWMNSLPLTEQTTLMKALVKENPARVNTHAAVEWSKRNAATVLREARDKEEMEKYRAEEKAAKRGPWATPRTVADVRIDPVAEKLRAARDAKPRTDGKKIMMGPTEYGWVFDENGNERPMTKAERDQHDAEAAEYIAKYGTPEAKRWLDNNAEIKRTAASVDLTGGMGGPGKGKTGIIKDLDFMKNRVQKLKIKRPRKRDLKGFIKREE